MDILEDIIEIITNYRAYRDYTQFYNEITNLRRHGHSTRRVENNREGNAELTYTFLNTISITFHSNINDYNFEDIGLDGTIESVSIDINCDLEELADL